MSTSSNSSIYKDQTFDTLKIQGSLAQKISFQSGPGALDVNSTYVKLTGEGTGDALTLADGQEGQQMFLAYVAESAGADTMVLTPANFTSGTTLTFTNVGDSAHIVFLNGGWHYVGGAATVA